MSFGGAITLRGTNKISFSSTTGVAGATFTPAVNDLIIVHVQHVSTGNSITSLTASSWGITFTQATGCDLSEGDGAAEVWIGRVGTSASDQIDVVRTAANASHFAVFQISGAKSDGTPQSALGQTLTSIGNQPSPTSYNIGTFSSFTTDSATFQASAYSGSTFSYTTPPGYTEVYANTTTSPLQGIYWRTDEDLTPDVTFSARSSFQRLYAFAFEILAEGGASGSIIPQIMHHRRQMQ
jgi:hypothetical protein